MRRYILSIIVTFFVTSIYAGVFTVNEYQGMNTVENELLINPSKSPDMDNVDISEDGISIKRRKGQDLLFTITYSTYHVRSFGSVKNNSYDKLLVSYGNFIEAYDTAYTATIIHSSTTVGYAWDFAQYLENTYCTNGVDTVFYTDGSTKTFVGSAPKGTSIVFFNNTCFIANTPGNKARLYIANYGDPTDWTTGTAPTDGDAFDIADYGEKVVDLEVLGNSVLVLCSKSIMKVVGTQNPYQVIEIDKSIGCNSKGSVSTYLGWTYFLGSDGQMYRTNGSIVEPISDDEFYDDFDNTALAHRTQNFTSFTTEDDFNNGITSYTTTSQSIDDVQLQFGSTDYADVQWDLCTLLNVDTATITNQVILDIKQDVILDNFSDGEITSNPTWDVSTGDWSVEADVGDDALKCNDNNGANRAFTGIGTVIENKTGFLYRFNIKTSDLINTAFEIYAYRDTTQLGSGEYKNAFKLYKNAGGTSFRLVTSNDSDSSTQSTVSVPLSNNVDYVFKLIQDGSIFKFYVDSTQYLQLENPTYYSNPSSGYKTEYRFDYSDDGDLTDYVFIDDVEYDDIYHSTGTITSPIIDTTFDLPVWGTITWDDTLPADTTVYYYVRSSTDSLMGDNPTFIVQPTYGQQMSGISNSRYIQFKASFTTTNLMQTPQVNDITLRYGTTGYYVTETVVIADVNTWGLFEADETLHDGTITYYTYSSNTIVSDSYLHDPSIWTLQTNNSTIAVATNTYVWGKAVFDISVAVNPSATPTLHSLTFNWVSGSDTNEDMASRWYNDRLYLGVMKTDASNTNDACFVFDPKFNAWWKYKSGCYPSAFTLWKNKFLIASSTCGAVAQFLEGDTDLGESINSYYYTKEIAAGGINLVSSFDTISFMYDKQDSGSLYINYYLNGSTTTENTYTLDMTGGNTVHIDNFNMPNNTNAYYIQFKIYNQNGEDFTFHQIIGVTEEFPFRVLR